MASSSKPCAASVLLLLLALGVTTVADAAKKSIASEPKSIFSRPSGPIFQRPAAKDIVTEPPVLTSAPTGAVKESILSGPIFSRPVAKDIIASESPVPTSAEVDVSATCMGSLLELSPCLAFFRDAGTSKAPAGCCKGLGSIVHDQPTCLCHIFNHTLERVIGVDIPVNRALALLRNVCGLTMPGNLMSSCGNKGGVPPLYVCPVPSA